MQPTNDGHGAYTFHDITLTEDMESISFALQGKQNLQRDAYLFLSEVNDGKESQPMVSVLSGVHNVDVELTLEIEMDIEDDEMIIEHVWRAEEMFPALPVTGDDSRPLLWAQLCVLSLTGAWLALKRRSRLSR